MHSNQNIISKLAWFMGPINHIYISHWEFIFSFLRHRSVFRQFIVLESLTMAMSFWEWSNLLLWYISWFNLLMDSFSWLYINLVTIFLNWPKSIIDPFSHSSETYRVLIFSWASWECIPIEMLYSNWFDLSVQYNIPKFLTESLFSVLTGHRNILTLFMVWEELTMAQCLCENNQIFYGCMLLDRIYH